MKQITPDYQGNNCPQNFDSDSGIISSPFGDASPLVSNNYKTRQSNVMKDCTGETLNMIFTH